MNYLEPYAFYFELPIYTPIRLGVPDNHDFYDLTSFTGTIDAYNPSLKENTTYKVAKSTRRGLMDFYETGGMDFRILTCVRTDEKFYVFFYYSVEKCIFQKIGQFPSIADFHISQIKKYNKVLSNEKLKEFTRAIGLAANGVGIGSFVYLRRIFEDLIEEAHIKAMKKEEWNEEEYSKQRMSEKIELLKNFLPAFLVENKTLYGILSIGIHSLNEEDCLAYFESVRVGIELILDEKVDIYQKQKKMEDAKKKIASLTGKIHKI